MERDSDGDSDGSGASQSKRPPLEPQDSDSQTSDHGQAPLPNQHNQHHQRFRAQKHVVGGGTAARLHGRVPSSKALYKLHAPSSSSKLNRRQASPSPDRGTAAAGAATGAAIGAAAAAAGHRRVASDQRLSRDSSSANLHLKKNSSHSSLKRNRSHVEASKKSGSAAALKRSSSNPTVTKLRSAKSQVHFDLGSDKQEDGQEDGREDDEWVDASNSASPYLSRRASIVSSGQSSARHTGSADHSADHSTADHSTANTPPSTQRHGDVTSGNKETAHSPDRGTTQHKEYITSRLLQRTPSHGAPPKMSAENASARPPSSRQHSPDSGMSRETTSTLSGTPGTTADARPESAGREGLTSRFIATSSQASGSGITSENSFYNANGQNGPRRPRSMGSLAQATYEHQQLAGAQGRPQGRPMLNDESTLTDEDDGDNVGLAANTRSRRRGEYVTPRAEVSRTQQKLNLQRASSNLEPTRHPGLGMGIGVSAVAGPLAGGTSYESRDPRLGKLLERTGMEYLVVRRYQNPVARSIARIAQLPGAERSRRIPQTAGARPGPSDHSGGQAKRGAENGSGQHGQRGQHGQHGPSQNPRDSYHQDGGSVAALMHSQAAKRPVTPRQSSSSVRANGNRSSVETSVETDEEVGRLHEGLSGSSLLEGEEDDGTMAILRNLWEKNLDLSASQD